MDHVFASLLSVVIAAQSPSLGLDALLTQVEQSNPSLQAASSRVEAAVAAIGRARSFEEAIASFEVRQFPTDPRMGMMPRTAIGSPMVEGRLGWMMPICGKRGLKSDLAGSMRDTARLDARRRVHSIELEGATLGAERETALAGLEMVVAGNLATTPESRR